MPKKHRKYKPPDKHARAAYKRLTCMRLPVFIGSLRTLNPDAREHAQAREALTYRGGARLWFLTWGIVYEFLRVSTRRAVFLHPLELADAYSWIASVLASPRCRLLTETERHAAILDELAVRHRRLAGNGVHEFLTNSEDHTTCTSLR